MKASGNRYPVSCSKCGHEVWLTINQKPICQRCRSISKSKKPWFDAYGNLLKKTPKQCVEDCSHQGECFEDVKHWQEKLNFQVPRKLAIEYLREYGAWDCWELQRMDETTLAQKVLWLACCDIKENGKWFGLIH
jgi:hypothetical protein